MLLTILFLVSCKTERYEKFKKPICGEWIFVRVGSDSDINNKKGEGKRKVFEQAPKRFENLNYRKGYIFYSNGSCEDKRGYFKQIDGKSHDERRTVFLGTDTKYEIEDDSLKIFNLVDSTWKGIKIRSITPDTLTLEVNDTVYFKYARINYKTDKAQSFDMIIVSTSDCYGTCPISSTCIDKYGNYIFYGQNYTTKSGLYKTKTDQSLYLRIENNFKKADINNLNENYWANWTDDQTISVTFIKNNQIHKTVSDYGRQAPREFYWACIQLQYLYQRLNLKPFSANTTKPVFIVHTYFENNDKVCELLGSEAFYLTTELYKGKASNHKFDKKYILRYRDFKGSWQNFWTDGRYYEYKKNKKTTIIDLGYNFLMRNNLNERFRQKNEYD